MTDKVLSLIGLCRRAGGVVPGAGAVIDELRRGKVKAVFVSCDSSERTKKQTRDKAAWAEAPLFELQATSDSLGHAIGLTAPCAVLALTGKGPWSAAVDAARKSHSDQTDND